MPRIKWLLTGLLGGGFLFMTLLSQAEVETMNHTLRRIDAVLQTVSPLIIEAEHQQDPRARVMFQFDRLRADIAKIRAGLHEQLQRQAIEPRRVSPVVGDYLSAPKKSRDSLLSR